MFGIPALCRVDATTGGVTSFGKGNGQNQQQKPTTSNHLQISSEAAKESEKIITGRRRGPQNQVSSARGRNIAQTGGSLSVPWAESAAPSALVVSTTRDMYCSAEDRDRNFRKHLRKQFREYHLEHLIPSTLAVGEQELDDNERAREAEQDAEYARRKELERSRGVRDLKMTTLPNISKAARGNNNHNTNNVLPRREGVNALDTSPRFCASIDEIGQHDVKNQKSSMRLHNAGARTRLEPYLVYEDEVAHLPAVPQVGITYTGAKPEDRHEVVFPWDRPRVGADGAQKLARREARRLVTQRRLEFAEQFLPEALSSMTTKMSQRVAEQFNTRGVGQPEPLALGALENASLRANAGANPALLAQRGTVPKVSLTGSSGDHQHQQQQRLLKQQQEEAAAAAAARKKLNPRVEAIKRQVQDIVEDHAFSLKKHDLIMQVAVTAL